ncbi:DUF945 family protein [Psychromonas antarctica]|uniref:DUF945 family protein n=1 Tax=Psychromonas antarctica TaxID=67573 RepID=UPI001EE93044|nr:DUF945 family protein [Psychromonas antarctica]MCG6201161.1 YdgA family protein [Psychromonas antarctica]
MKKLLISLFVVITILLFSTYFMGEMVKNETQKMFVKSVPQGVTSKLIRYDKGFLRATAVSEVRLAIEGEAPLVFDITSSIQHYPYKAVIDNQIKLRDPLLTQKVETYFASKDWLTSIEEVNLCGQLTGQLTLMAGSSSYGDGQFATKAVTLDYQMDLHHYTGAARLDWGGLQILTSEDDFSVESLHIKSNFNLLSAHSEYDYFVDIAKVAILQADFQSRLAGIELLGSSRTGEQVDTIDTSTEWRIARYEIDQDSKKLFTNNHIKLDIKGLYSPALNLLRGAAEDHQQVQSAFAALLDHGGQLTLSKLNSQTPWGKVTGHLAVTVQPGAVFSDITLNPFMLLDYISGDAQLLLPEALLQQPNLSESLQLGLNTGFLIREATNLSFETQFEQGELTVNGKVIPL